jgi:hypothetical protein
MLNAGTVQAFATLDDKGFTSGMSNMKKQGDKFAKSMATNFTQIGKSLTTSLTLPLGLAGAGMIKLASDAEETSAKFNTVFSSINADAQNSAKVLTDSFGLSKKASEELLGNTGDLLTGFGFTQSAALDLSTEVNKLAVDLASFTNFSGGAEGASAALTKALLGERESVKSLGISILEADVNAKMLVNTQKGLTFESERQAKAFATLQLAQEQSKNAIGDFARTSDSFANQTRQLRAEISDLAVDLGQKLLPIATKLIGKARDMVKGFINLSDNAKTLGLAIAGIAFIAGPTILALGTLASAISAISLPVLGVIAVVGGIGFAFAKALKQTGSATGAMQLMLDKMLNHTISVVQDMLKTMDWAGLGIFDSAISALDSLKRNVEDTDAFTPLADATNFIKDSFNALKTSMSAFNLDPAKKQVQEFGDIVRANFEGIAENVRVGTIIDADAEVEGFKKVDTQIVTTKTSLDGLETNAMQSSMAMMGLANSIGNIFERAALQGENLSQVLKGILKQLAARAFVTGIGALLSGGASLGTDGFLKTMFGGMFHSGGVVQGSGDRMIRAKGGEMVLTKSQQKALSMGMTAPSGGMSSEAMSMAFERALDKKLGKLGAEEIYYLTRKGQFTY